MSSIHPPVKAPDPRIGNELFRVADWYVDPQTDRIRRGQQTVHLEPKVMEVLVFLAAQPGRVISREELESTVWAGTVVSYDALTSTMLKLRKALDDTPRNSRFIETVPKRGYRLVAEVRPVTARAEAPVAGLGARLARHWASASRGVYAAVLIGLVIVIAGAALWYQQSEPRSEVARSVASNKVSVAVLPFTNLGQKPGQDYFVNGMTNELITRLTKLSSLLMISRDSTFIYRGAPVDVYKAASALKVRYVLHGSVRRDDTHVRINAVLTDTRSGNNIWAQRYDAEAKNLFQLQDDIASKIISALALKLTPAERQAVLEPDTDNIEAYDYFLKGADQFFLYARASNEEARRFFRKAIELDPKFSRAYAMLAWTHAFDFMNGWSETPKRSLALGDEFATRALALNANLPVAHFVRGLVYRERGDPAKAMADAERAVALDPSYANGHILLASLLYYAGRPQDGLEKIKMAIRLNPHYPYNYPFHLGQAYFVLKRYPEAITAFSEGLESNPGAERLHVWLAASYAQDGQIDEAVWEMEQIKAVNPEISLERQKQAFPFKDPSDLARFVDGLKRAGLDK